MSPTFKTNLIQKIKKERVVTYKRDSENETGAPSVTSVHKRRIDMKAARNLEVDCGFLSTLFKLPSLCNKRQAY